MFDGRGTGCRRNCHLVGCVAAKGFPLSTQGRRDWRLLVFLAVLMSHAVFVFLVIRSARLLISLPKDAFEPLVLLLLHDNTRAAPDAPTTPRAPISPRRAAEPRAAAPDAGLLTVPPTVAPAAAPQPEIDWQREAELAVQNALADNEKQGGYRDLSTLSPEQLGWIKRNHMQPVPPGIEWHHPRFEFDRHSGLPIFWINDHCVLVTLMVFCAIGKIEASGELFKHMRDPSAP
jgi:hypothetical protein